MQENAVNGMKETLSQSVHEPKPVRNSSCFDSNELMEEAVQKAIQVNGEEIQQWLLDPDNVDRLLLKADLKKDIGTSVAQYAEGSAKKQKVFLLLEKNPEMPEKFYIVTGYPI